MSSMPAPGTYQNQPSRSYQGPNGHLKPCPSTVERQRPDLVWRIGCICVLAILLLIFVIMLIAFLIWALSHPPDTYGKHLETAQPKPFESDNLEKDNEGATLSPEIKTQTTDNEFKLLNRDYYDYD
uniref:Uncharacterized protein n=1 Tax=Strigamia maritima TaxID=126957 RepID=T1JE19_STRMM